MKLPAPRLPGSFSLCFSHDGEMLACVGTRLNIFATSDWKKLCTIRPFSNLCDGAFSHSGHMFAVKNTLGRIAVIYPASGQVLSAFRAKGDEYGSPVSFVRDDSQLADGTWDGIFRFRSPLGGEILDRIESLNEMVTDLSYDHDSKFLWVAYMRKVLEEELSSKHDSYLLRLDLNSTAPQQQRIELEKNAKLSTNIQCVRLSPNGKLVGLVRHVRNLRAKRAIPKQQFEIRSAADGVLICQSDLYETPFPRSDLSWSPDGKFAAAPISEAFILLETRELREVGRIPWHYSAAVAFHPKDNVVVLGSSSNSKVVKVEEFFVEKQRSKLRKL